jgi:branched-chain amino acid transport system permease protein
VPLPVAFLIAAVMAGIIGILLDRVAFAPLRRRNAGTLVPLISSIGVAIVIGAILRGIYGVDERHFTAGGLDAPPMHLGPVAFTAVELIIFFSAIGLMLVLSWLLRATTLGRRIRAVAEDRVAAALLGVNLERTIAATFFIASSLGGAAGILTGLEYNSVTLDMGGPIELKGLAIIILGGMGSITGAVVGAFIIGAVETLATAYGLSEWRNAIVFGVMFLILIARPTGLFGKRSLRTA